MRRCAYSLLACLAGCSSAAASDAPTTWDRGPDVSVALRASQAAIGGTLGDHRVTDQHGRPLELASLRGRPLLLTFVFTNCSDVCSGAMLHLRNVNRIARDALGEQSYSILTVGFDVENDTPQRMAAFAGDRGIVDPNWLFASTDAATLRRLAGEAGFTWAASPAGFDHVTQVTLVDATGRVVQQVYGAEFAPPALVEPLKRLVLRQNLERSTLRSLIDSARLFCTAYDPVADRYRFDYAMLAGALPALLVLGMLAAGILLASRRGR